MLRRLRATPGTINVEKKVKDSEGEILYTLKDVWTVVADIIRICIGHELFIFITFSA